MAYSASNGVHGAQTASTSAPAPDASASATPALTPFVTPFRAGLAASDWRKDDRKPCLGGWIMLGGYQLAKMIARSGVDWALIDTEHGHLADQDMQLSVAAIASAGVSPLVRIPADEPYFVKRALDAGAHGVMVPMVETPEQAERVAKSARFPMQGYRGVGSQIAHQYFGANMKPGEYIATANQSIKVIVQIESRTGLKNAAAIAAVPDVDALFIGPNDLCSSMGYPALQHRTIAEVQDAAQQVLDAAHSAGKPCGYFCMSAEEASARFAQGFDFTNVAADTTAVEVWMGAEVAKTRKLAAAKA